MSGLSDEVRARLAWSVLAEPGDTDAGVLVAELGASEALAVVREEHAALQESPERRSALRRWLPRLAVADEVAAAAGDAAHRVGAALLVPGRADWPAGVDDLGPAAPFCLWARGDTAALASQATVAVVGARAATRYGEMMAAELAGGLARDGVVVVSGAAYGIDAASHRAALAESGRTVAVLAGGVDRVYPAGHAHLLADIARAGAILSEVPAGATPTRWRFLARNRIIAALGRATVVVEAGWRSGSLNTAGHAAGLGRPVGAVPGPVTSPTSAGCHRLLREYGATCVTTAAEVSELWEWTREHGAVAEDEVASATDASSLSGLQRSVCGALSRRIPRTIEDVALRAGLDYSATRSVIGALTTQGRVREAGDGWVLTG